MTVTRIYLVRDPEFAGAEELVEASSTSQALRYVATKRYAVKVATPKEVAELIGGGARLQSAGDEPATERAEA
jgi:hypothetical protein